MAATVDPGIDWPAAVGLYVATATAGLVALLAVAAGASSDAILGLIPTVFTGGLLCGAIAARHGPAFAIRLGTWRWRIVALCLPALVVAGGFGVLTTTAIVPRGWLLPLVAVAVLGIGLPARLLALVAHDTAVGAEIERENRSAATWTWYQSGTDVTAIGYGVGCFLLVAILSAENGFGRGSFQLSLLGTGLIAFGWAPTLSIPNSDGSKRTVLSIPDVNYVRGEIRAYETGLVFEPRIVPSYRRLVPSERITDVRLTDDHLVLERRRRPAIRCDRSRIDDLEGVLQALETSDRAPHQPTV
ncbi:hypothetical protein [Natronorubrum sp. FCH18a]|uniref:hypothetical protein n=1 Tax=Natronorubrum sp. FCH18a TaxID=3447018 RepID=UPI003F518D55